MFFHSVWFLNHWHDFSRFMIANKFMVLHFVYIKSFLPFFFDRRVPCWPGTVQSLPSQRCIDFPTPGRLWGIHSICWWPEPFRVLPSYHPPRAFGKGWVHLKITSQFTLGLGLNLVSVLVDWNICGRTHPTYPEGEALASLFWLMAHILRFFHNWNNYQKKFTLALF